MQSEQARSWAARPSCCSRPQLRLRRGRQATLSIVVDDFASDSPFCYLSLGLRMKSESFPAPVGHEVIAPAGELLLLGAVGEHTPDFVAMVDFALKDDVAAIRGPRRKVVASCVVGQLSPALAGDVHNVDIASARRTGAILAVPGEDEELSVWRPGGRG